MSLQMIKIVEEEFARGKASITDTHCAHGKLDALEARIMRRITHELPETFEQTLRERYTSLSESDFPTCDAKKCEVTAAHEGWVRMAGMLTGRSTGMVRRVFVCEDHKKNLIGSEEA